MVLDVPEDCIYVVEEGTEGTYIRRLGLEEFLFLLNVSKFLRVLEVVQF